MGYENRIATLILKNVTFAQEGTYYCHATNTHGTTVLPSEVKVVPEKAGDTIRISLARYDKQTGSEQLITNIHASHKDEEQQQTIGIHSSEKENVSGRCRAVPRQTKKIVEKTTELVSAEEVVVVSSPEQAAQKKQSAEQPPVVAEPSGQPSEAAAPPESAPVPPPRKHIPKEREVPVPITSEATRTEEEQKVRLVAVKFADTFTESVMNQAETDLSGALNLEESLVKIIAAPGAKILEEQSMVTKTEETIRKSPSRDSPTTSKIVTKSAVGFL
ncbi:hypothetical protein GCK32_008719 [Trichostrongylus colubriformis]|uniref:Immunoglobulin I-set domain-containing protein n=1 Tax=Trichostrongylus colubriformis TaxID=6319 RepID=A0AAN8F2F7_TRICO